MLKRVFTAMVATSLAALGAGCGGGGGTAERPSASADEPVVVTLPASESEALLAEAPAIEIAKPAKKVEKAGPAAGSERAEELVKELVRQLGDDDFKKREAASAELAKIGKPAVPALKEAKKNPDLEVARRAEEVLARIENRTAEATAPDMPGTAKALRGNRGAHVGMQIRMGEGIQAGEGVRIIGGRVNMQNVRSVRTEEGTATISESNEGITLVLKPREGEAKTFSAPSREEFKEKFPELYKQYIDPNG